ncbi:MAG: hypothetical protein GY746_00060 [Gammaproteobacteria bacterium]|nr:hypothetical protein [Gammaproteobacteria bacterium]
MNLIVHIGIEKTGTTTIQEMLFINRENLKSNGFYFLQCAGSKNNRKLPAYCINDTKNDDYFVDKCILSHEDKSKFREALRDDLRDELSALGSEIHTVLISSEQLSSRLTSDTEIRRFHKLMSPHFSNIRILCYLREQCEMAVSLYSTAMRSGVTLGFNEYLKKCQPDNGRYNYYKMINMWSSVFGLSSIDVRIFSKEAFVGGDLICDFLTCISPDLISVVDKSIDSQNLSISAFGQRLGLSINRLLPNYTDDRRLSKSALLRRRFLIIIGYCFPGRGSAPSAAEYQRIYDSFYESNKMLSERYLGKNHKLFEFSPPSQKKKSLGSYFSWLFKTH